MTGLAVPIPRPTAAAAAAAAPAPIAIPIPIPSTSHASSPTIRPRARQGKSEPLPSTSNSPPTPPRTGDTEVSAATAHERPATGGVGPEWPSSFATANESWEHSEEFRRIRRAATSAAIITTTGAVAAVDSGAGASTISTPNSFRAGAHDSQSSLLRRDRSDQRRLSDPASPSPGKKESLEELNPSPWNNAPSIRVSTNTDRVTGGLVRFNTADLDILRDREEHAQQKAAGLSRARSLRLGKRRRSSLGRHDGEILKMGSMLVRVEATYSMRLPDDYDENESLKVDTRIVDKWREYVVVCRENDDPDVPMVLRFYKSRTIPAVDKQHVSSRSAREIPLNPKTTRANLFSSLDKTLVLWLPAKRGTSIYIMRPKCASSSVEWYTFLCTALGEPQCKLLQLSVPDLTLTINIENPFDREDHTKRNAEGDITEIAERDVAGTILKKSMHMLENVNEWQDILEHWKKHERMGLAWRRYDRLEWVHGVNEQRMDGSIAMQKTHELELRPKIHYPTECTLEAGEKMTEPPPVEGFLVRLTSGKGRGERLGRKFQKRQYWATHDQYLCYCQHGRALPPAPPTAATRGSVTPTPSEIAARMPLIYAVSPFALNADCDIEWLANNPTPAVVTRKDEEAYHEAERRVNLLGKAEGFVDLTKATQARRVVPPESSPGGGGDGPADESDGSTVENNDEMCFEIVLDNGVALKLQAFDAQTRDEWIVRLDDLIKYWRARDRGDLAIIRRTRDTNLKQLNMDEEMESLMGQFGRKWEVSRTIASGELFNVCGLSSCRTITVSLSPFFTPSIYPPTGGADRIHPPQMSGPLYRKPRRHATFRRYNVILCNGELLIFQHTLRGRTGKEVRTALQEKHLTFPLRDCYIYSGLITSSDLLYQNRTFDSNAPGRHALPRIYADGYMCHDEDSMTCFVLWRGARRSIFTKRDDEGTKLATRMVPPLGHTGKAIVFKARSRLERDTWVLNITMEIERLNVGVPEEINVAMPKK